MKEEWKTLPDYEGIYEVSNTGKVKKLARTWQCGPEGRITRESPEFDLKQIPDKDGYFRVNLHLDGHKTLRSVHSLVLEAFVGKRPEGMECRHLDGKRSHNDLDNLCWGTKKENAADRAKHGWVHPRGMKGKKHSEKTKAKLRKVSLNRWDRVRKLEERLDELEKKSTDKPDSTDTSDQPS